MTTQQLLIPSSATLKRNVMNYSLIVIGSFLQALSRVLFPAPYKIVPGGAYDIFVATHCMTKDLFLLLPNDLSMGATALCFNIPLMISTMKEIGLSSGPKTIVTFLLISIFTDSLSYFLIDPLVENDAFIVTLYGGAILGLGVTCIFQAQSMSAGTDVLACVTANDFSLKVSNMITVLDSAVALLGLIMFRDWAVPLYSWFAIFVYERIMETFQTENPNHAVFVVSRKIQELKISIVGRMGMEGASTHGKGMYQGNETEITFTIAERKDMPRLRGEVKEIDPNTFVSTMYVSKGSPWSGI